MDEEYVVEVHNLSKSFGGKPAVVNLSLNVKKGEIFGFLGPNGSGKTTTIRMLCGLMIPDSGTGECLGYDIYKDSHMIKRLVGYVPQTFSLYKDLTVRENLEFITRVYEEKNYKFRIEEMMKDLDLKQFENRLAGKLSGGWKQRLSLAAALIHDPKLLLLDEPTAGVDPKARREFWNYISHLTASGITALVSTHYMDEAERCNRLAYIVYGHLMAEGTIPQIIEHVNLITWSATGKHLGQLARDIAHEPGIEQVIAWGNELRICGNDAPLIDAAIARHHNFEWRRVDTSLEEVFIHLVETQVDERQT
ncbi:MAG: ABC transporter ATP-binding protein [Gammaproteobacteria bacterium]|nr:ABC transporter ATP-binding protein [Gammaproteobacteria bacterium]